LPSSEGNTIFFLLLCFVFVKFSRVTHETIVIQRKMRVCIGSKQ
jgi:hypothetical protein